MLAIVANSLVSGCHEQHRGLGTLPKGASAYAYDPSELTEA